MAYTITNNKIAGISKNGLVYGGFKFVHLYSGIIEQPKWINEKGKITVERDEDGKVIKQEIEGLTLFFQYKNRLNKWSGLVINDENGERTTKGCLEIAVPLPKTLNTQSKLYKLFVLLGIVERAEFVVTSEENLIGDEDEQHDLNLEDLMEDVENSEDSEQLEFNLDNISNDILNHLNKVFLAPFTLTNNDYPVINNDFDLWEIPNVNSKKK